MSRISCVSPDAKASASPLLVGTIAMLEEIDPSSAFRVETNGWIVPSGLFKQRLDAALQAIVDLLNLRNRPAVLRVGDDHLTRIHQRCRDAACQKSSGCDHARQALAEGNHIIAGARREFTDGGNASQQLVERIELRS